MVLFLSQMAGLQRECFVDRDSDSTLPPCIQIPFLCFKLLEKKNSEDSCEIWKSKDATVTACAAFQAKQHRWWKSKNSEGWGKCVVSYTSSGLFDEGFKYICSVAERVIHDTGRSSSIIMQND